MYKYYYDFMAWLSSSYSATWQWINSLDRQEWLMLLSLVAGLGFFCMRGYGSRSNY